MSSTSNLESAIPPHLQCARSTPSHCGENYIPPFDAYTTRFPESITQVVTAIIGVQSTQTPTSSPGVIAEITKIASFLAPAPDNSTPSFWEPCAYTDASGAFSIAAIAYWPSVERFEEWKEKSGFAAWWQVLDAPVLEYGFWMEVFSPTMDRVETALGRSDIEEGMGHMGNGPSGAVREHGYWGGMRDRLPIAQVDTLCGEKVTKCDAQGLGAGGDTQNRRIVVPGRKNLVVVRSGQDWSGTSPEEHKLYTETMHPVLVRGMDFLRNEGAGIGCYSCRFMECWRRDVFTADEARTFGLAYFDEMANLEKWTKSHKTHVDIFGRFLKYVKEAGDGMGLKLWHEVYVLEPEQQYFEYIGCHENTGMLVAL